MSKSNRYATGQAYLSGQYALQRKTCNHREHQYDGINFNSYFTGRSWWARTAKPASWLAAGWRSEFDCQQVQGIFTAPPRPDRPYLFSVLSVKYRGLSHKYLRLPYTSREPNKKSTDKLINRPQTLLQNKNWVVGPTIYRAAADVWSYKIARFLITELGKRVLVWFKQLFIHWQKKWLWKCCCYRSTTVTRNEITQMAAGHEMSLGKPTIEMNENLSLSSSLITVCS